MAFRYRNAATRCRLGAPRALGLAAAGLLMALAPVAAASQAVTYTRKGDTVVVRPAHQPHTVTTTRIVRTADGRLVQREVTRERSREHVVVNQIVSDARRGARAANRHTPRRHTPVVIEERPRSIHGGGFTHLQPIYEGREFHNAQTPSHHASYHQSFGRASGVQHIHTRSTVTPAFNHRITPRTISQTTCTTTQHGVFPGTVVRSPVYTRTVHHHHYTPGIRYTHRSYRAPSVSVRGTIGGGNSRVGFQVGQSFHHGRSHIGYRHNWNRGRSGLHIRIGN